MSYTIPPDASVGAAGHVNDHDLIRAALIDIAATIAAGSLADDAVTNAKLANMVTARLKGRTTAGTGDPEDLTGTQVTAMLDQFSSTLKGLAPLSGGGTSNFLRADGSWAVPSVGGAAAIQDVNILVASNDAPTSLKDRANYVCNASADQTEINNAITDAATSPYYTGVQLSGGQFILSSAILMKTGVTLRGVGVGTELKNVSNSATGTGSGTYAACIKAYDINVHATRVTDMWLNGNFASGGSCHGIAYTGSSGGDSHSARPDTNPDPDNTFDHLFITGFSGGGTKHGIWMDTDERGTMISNIQMRSISGDGIYFASSPDSHISMCHIGTITGHGYNISGGNVKLTNCKSFYCDGDGFRLSSGRGSLAACESQDNNVGFRFDGAPYNAVGITADTCQTDGIIVSTSQLILNGFTIFNRSGGRYATTTRGLYFDASYSDNVIVGEVTPSSITTPISGTAGSRCFQRTTNGSSLVAVG